jgi:hypothetical protein
MDLLTTYTLYLELKAITAPLIISTIYKSPQLSLFQPAVSSSAVPCQGLLTVEIVQLHMLRSCVHSLPCRTLSTNFTVCILWRVLEYILFRVKIVKHNKYILDFNVLLKPLFRYLFRSHRTIIRQLNIGIRLVIELLVWIHVSATRHVYKVTELPQVNK